MPTLTHAVLHRALATTWLKIGGAHDDTVISMSLDMFLEILRALEGLATELALVRLQGNVDSDVGGDVVALDGGGAALTPRAGQVEVVSRLAANMTLADVFLLGGQRRPDALKKRWTHIEGFSRGAALAASLPLALQIFTRGVDTRRRIRCERWLELPLLLASFLSRRRIGGSRVVL